MILTCKLITMWTVGSMFRVPFIFMVTILCNCRPGKLHLLCFSGVTYIILSPDMKGKSMLGRVILNCYDVTLQYQWNSCHWLLTHLLQVYYVDDEYNALFSRPRLSSNIHDLDWGLVSEPPCCACSWLDDGPRCASPRCNKSCSESETEGRCDK